MDKQSGDFLKLMFTTTITPNYRFLPNEVRVWRSDEGLTLETSAFLPFPVANLRFQLSC